METQIRNFDLELLLDKYHLDKSLEFSLTEKFNIFPELYDILLNHNIKPELVSLIANTCDDLSKLTYEDIWAFKYSSFSQKLMPYVNLIQNNLTNVSEYNFQNYSYIDLDNLNYISDDVLYNTFFDKIKFTKRENLYPLLTTGTNFRLYLPKDKYQIIKLGNGVEIIPKIHFDKNVIVHISYEEFIRLDDNIISKLSNCSFVFKEGNYKFNQIIKNNYYDNNVNIMANHLFYILNKIHMDNNKRELILFTLKNLYFNNLDDFIKYAKNIAKKLEIIKLFEIKKLSEEFNNDFDYLAYQEIIKPEWNAKLFLDEFFMHKDTSANAFMNKIDGLTDDQIKGLLKDKRVQKILNLTHDINKDTFYLKNRYSKTLIDFITRKDLNLNLFLNNPDNNLENIKSVNEIVSKYGIFDYDNKIHNISVADIVGMDILEKDVNILEMLSSFYAPGDGEDYLSRSNSLLNYTDGESLINGLNKTNNGTKDMKATLVDNGKYLITNNGFHRFILLKFFYLYEKMLGKEQLSELKDKYNINITIERKVNLFRTYLNYLISLTNSDIIRIDSYFDYETNINKIVIVYSNKDKNGKFKAKIVSDDELLDIISKYILFIKREDYQKILDNYLRYESFKDFMDAYFPQITNIFSNREVKDIRY